MPKGKSSGSRRKSPRRSKSPKRRPSVARKVDKPAPRFRKVTYAPRLSARHYYDNTGNLGDTCWISGYKKKLLLRTNGSPYWQKCTENVEKNYGKCRLNCKDPAGM